MVRDEFEYIGKITKSFGTNGEFIFKIENQDFDEFNLKEPVYVEMEHKPVPFFIKSFDEKSNNSGIIIFNDIISESRTRLLINKKIFLQKKKRKRKFQPENISGFSLYDEQLGLIGTINNINVFSANLVIEVTYRKKDIMIPLSDELITEIIPDKKIIKMRLPEGLLDIYFD